MATIQMRSTKECQNLRTSNFCNPSAYWAVKSATTGLSEFVEAAVATEGCEWSITADYRLQSYTNKRGGKGARPEKFVTKKCFPRR
jgi:uncharacterized Fe-S cluster-containing MiaB family protein